MRGKKQNVRLWAVAFWLIVWQLAAMALHAAYPHGALLLPSPVSSLARLISLAGTAVFWCAIGTSSMHILGGFLLSCALAVVLAALSARFSRVKELLAPLVAVVKTVPVASFIIICLIWMSTRQLAVFISFLMVFPVIYSNTLQGIKSADGALLEMARVYRVPFSRQLGYIYAPQVKPFLLSGCSVALGMSWKSGVAAEVIGVVGGSIGERLYEAKVYFQMTDLLAWTVVIVVCSVGFEKLVLWLLRRGFAAWEGR